MLSRFVYSLPYLNLYKAEKEKVNCLIRQTYKAALHLPRYTSTERLLKMGIHNTFDELVEAHRTAQYERLTKTPAGRHILRKLNIPYESTQTNVEPVPRDIFSRLRVDPIPKNMHPEYHSKRRQARAKALQKHYANHEEAVYVDVAELGERDAFSAGVVGNDLKPITAFTIFGRHAEEAEEAAIAIAITNTAAKIIFCDSKTAVRNFAKGRIHEPALQILKKTHFTPRQIKIIWIPAHSSHPGNEAAHNFARGLVNRAVSQPILRGAKERMITYHEITQYYKNERLEYPPPDKSLTKNQQATWRKLQTHTFPNPYKLSIVYPGIHSPECTLCEADKADLAHILHECPELKPRAEWQLSNREHWEAAVTRSEPAVQLRAV